MTWRQLEFVFGTAAKKPVNYMDSSASIIHFC